MNRKIEFMIAGVSSGVGKTTITLGLISALKKRGMTVSAFKCGPDYIDTSYHSFVSGSPAINLDLWIMGEDGLKECYERNSKESQCNIIEGVMGLFDGVDVASNFGSSAHIASIINVPVILVVDSGGMARSVAALVKGYCEFMPELKIAGVIANRVGSKNHGELIKKALVIEGLPPLLGYMTHDNELTLQERHLGLIPQVEEKFNDSYFENLVIKTEDEIDINFLIQSVASDSEFSSQKKKREKSKKLCCIGIAKDEAFSFYYPENLKALIEAGAELIEFSPLHDKKLPKKLDMLYIGGGFPEVYIEQLSENSSMRESIKVFADNGNTIYAECGGLMYLSSKIKMDKGINYSMCEVLPFTTLMDNKLRRLGYREIKTMTDSILGKAGIKARGHEFHYSYIEDDSQIVNIYDLIYPERDNLKSIGYQLGNVLASYVHLYWGNRPEIAESIVASILKNQ